MLDEVLERDPLEGDVVDLRAAGEPADGDYVCADCGYGVTLQTELPRCPMCGGEDWERL